MLATFDDLALLIVAYFLLDDMIRIMLLIAYLHVQDAPCPSAVTVSIAISLISLQLGIEYTDAHLLLEKSHKTLVMLDY
jgi:hypothetical protein